MKTTTKAVLAEESEMINFARRTRATCVLLDRNWTLEREWLMLEL